MNIIELQLELNKLDVPRRVYSLRGAVDERLCLDQRNGTWFVFFMERGQEINLKEFASESFACEYMLNELKYEI